MTAISRAFHPVGREQKFVPFAALSSASFRWLLVPSLLLPNCCRKQGFSNFLILVVISAFSLLENEEFPQPNVMFLLQEHMEALRPEHVEPREHMEVFHLEHNEGSPS